jgi:hypothetical protein
VKMNRKNFRFFGIFVALIIIVLLLYFVLAAPDAPTNLIINQNVTPVYDEGNFTVNWTAVTNNVTFSYNIYRWVNSSTAFVYFGNVTNNSAQGYSFNNWTEGNYTFRVAAINATQFVEGTNSTNISMYVDRTAPVITLPVYTNGTAKKNTTSLTLNISVIDASSGETGSVCLIDVNGTNQSIAVSSNWCNITSGNLTGLADGSHTIKVYVNDTVNILGLNNSLAVLTDTTAPVASASCSPSSASLGDSVTCSCSGTDATSGINSSLTTSSSTVTTAETGSYSYGCSVTDNAGNSHSTTTSYSVSGGSSGTTGTSGTTSFWTAGTHAISDEAFASGASVELQSKKRARVSVGGENHYVGVVSLTETKATINITSDPIQVVLGIGEDAKVDVIDDGFYDIYVILNSIANNKVDVTIQKIHEEIPAEEESPITTSGEVGGEETEEKEEAPEERSLIWLWIVIGVLVLAAAGSRVVVKKRKQ